MIIKLMIKDTPYLNAIEESASKLMHHLKETNTFHQYMMTHSDLGGVKRNIIMGAMGIEITKRSTEEPYIRFFLEPDYIQLLQEITESIYIEKMIEKMYDDELKEESIGEYKKAIYLDMANGTIVCF